MRPILRHPIGERRRPHRTRGKHRAAPAPEPGVAAQERAVAAQAQTVAAQAQTNAPQRRDIAVQRVREAGGPTDRASYTCQCGYLFAAAVSTTVECPHCGAPQAW